MKAAFKAEGSLASSHTTDITTKIPVFTRVGKTVFIEHVGGSPLEGALITGYTGWRVFPADKNQLSRVVARLKVREDWISFGKIEVTKAPPSMLPGIMKRLKSPKHRDCFEILLKHLAAMELREYNATRLEATIAAHTLLVKPVEDLAVSIAAPAGAPRIAIDGKAVGNYFKGDERFEAANLMSLGLPSHLVKDAVSASEIEATQSIDYVPDGSPVHAAELFAELHKSDATRTALIKHQTALKDLQGLKLVTGGRGGYVKVTNHVSNPEATLRYTAAQIPFIDLARSMLKTNAKTTGREIADAIALQFGKEWKVGTRKRNGNSIKRWTLWLEPHLIDPSESNEAAALVAHAQDRTVTRGRSGAFRAIHLPRVKVMLEAGSSVPEIAAEIKVTRETIYNWLKWMRQKEAEGPEKELVRQRMANAYEFSKTYFEEGFSPHTTARRLHLPYNLAIEFHKKWLEEKKEKTSATTEQPKIYGSASYQDAAKLFARGLSSKQVARQLQLPFDRADQFHSEYNERNDAQLRLRFAAATLFKAGKKPRQVAAELNLPLEQAEEFQQDWIGSQED